MRTRRVAAALALAAALAGAASAARATDVLTTLDYRVVGVALRPVRTSLAIPKNVPGAVTIELIAGSEGNTVEELARGAVVEATLRGPSFAARRVVGLPNGDLVLPPLPLVGDYSLDDIRLVDVATGATRLDASPRSLPVTVFDEVLVSRVTSRPLTLDEIEARGITIDESSFRVLEFEVGFVLDGQTVPVRFPVVAPRFDGKVELIPKAELEALLTEAQAANAELALGAELPPELEAAGLDIDVQGVNFQFVEPAEDDDLALAVPPIPGLVVVPGRIGLLNQFFSVMLFTENAAPNGSGLSVRDLAATMTLPAGPDQIAGTHAAPGDDPLRFARVGPDAVIEPTQPVVGPGADGQLGSADDRTRLAPGDTGQAEFLVEGLREGLHVMDLVIDGTLDGLGRTSRRIRGFASGSVLVRNPRFSLAFTHPRTIRSGEPYTAAVTVLNTSPTPANLVSVTLPAASLSGAVFEPGTPEVAELGTILPGETATAEFRLRAQRTGAITFSQLTSDSDLVGRFRLRMGVDERGVALSPDAIGYPDFAEDVRALSPALFQAFERYLGQALSVATAAQLPPGVEPVSRGALESRVLAIAEAGQRLRYGDTAPRVLADLLLDFQGARRPHAGLDQIWRETGAGRELREALLAALAAEAAEPGAVALLAARAADLAGRGEPWLVAAVDAEAWSPAFELAGALAELGESEIGNAAGFSGSPSAAVDGHWIASRPIAGMLRLVAGADAPAAELALLDLAGDGTGTLWRWPLPALPRGACLRAALGGATAPPLAVDETCDGSSEAVLAPASEPVVEPAPAVLAAVQDEQVLAGRPSKPCPRPDIRNYGTVVGVLFSKPMTQASVDVPGAYRFEDGNGAESVQIQPGGRVALLNLGQPVGTLVARTLSVAPEVTDPRGNPLTVGSVPLQATAAIGVSIAGRVIRASGEPAAGVPVTLTIYDEVMGFACEPATARPAQARSDAEGRFHFDYVPAGIPYSVSATDTSGLSSEAEALILAASSDAQLDRARLLELASGSAAGTLLEQFAAGALPQAIAAAEGLDRALLRDHVAEESARVGGEVPVALRFRGRGTVLGTVFEPDGVTPSPGAAVNLFPDPDSRELGRGVFSDASGRFAFFGVPLGAFSIDAASPSGRGRTVSGVLLAPGEGKDVPVVLASAVVPRGAIEGRVLEPDGSGHGGARLFVGRYDEVTGEFTPVVSVATADPQGFYRAENVPVGTWVVLAVSFDGRRRGERANVGATAASASIANVMLQGRTTVRGRVEFANGAPGAFALVAGGEALVRADADGHFVATGVPTGRRSIEAAVEADPARGIDFTRIGRASLDVIAGLENFVVVRLTPAGRILGVVRDAAGNPVPDVDVSIPQEGGFLWVHANAQGQFEFPNLALDDYTVSAPAPPHEDADVSGILDTLSGSPTSEELQAALQRAFEIFTGVNDPLLTGEGLEFRPSRWGYVKTALDFDGQTAFADVRYLPEGTIAGRVLNGQGVPIGARVRLTGIGPTRKGDVGFQVRGERDSDPALGTFTFPGQALAGDFGVQAATPFYPAPISVSGQTSRIDPDRSGLVLQFPSEAQVNGRLAGHVFAPDGSPVANAKVKISFGDLEIRSDASGRFDTQLDLPAFDARGEPRGYAVEAEDEATGLRGQTVIVLRPGITNEADVHLIPRGGAVRVRVVDGTGQPVAGADVTLRQGTFPHDELAGTTDAGGELLVANLFEGSYAASASAVLGVVRRDGAAAVSVAAGVESLVVVRLGATATLRGVFVALDRTTPIPFAQIRVGDLGFAATDAAGAFEVTGVPLGTHQLVGQDALTGRLGTLTVSLATAGEIRDLLLVERTLGLVEGAVLDAFGAGTVPGARVTLSIADGFSPPRSVTTDPAGRFAFPGVPAGALTLAARLETLSGIEVGSASATLPAGAASLRVDVALAPRTRASVVVLEPNGIAPADASVTLTGPDFEQTADTDAAGRAVFESIPLGTYTVTARSRVAGQTRSHAAQSLHIDVRPAHPELVLTLGGVGRVEGHLFASDGTTPIANRTVELTMVGAGVRISTATGAGGTFAFDDVALGDFRLVGRDGALAASGSGTIAADGDLASVELALGPSGRVVGRLVSQDGALAIASAEVSIAYQAPSGALGRDAFRTAADGLFHFEAIPVGAFALESLFPARHGVLSRTGAIASDGETVDLGDVRLDEEEPHVVASEPVAGDETVSTGAVVRLTLNEPLDPASIDPRGIFLRPLGGALVPADVELVVDPVAGDLRALEIRPDAPLASETDYEAIVVDGDLLDALGTVVAQGPRDLVGRALAAPFRLAFRTRDQDPPGLLSISPAAGAIQIDPRAVVRLSFDEPLAPAGIDVTLTGPGGAVTGRVDVGVGAQVVVFTPDTPLAPNATYTARIDGVRDVAGNLAEGLPLSSSFTTLDTLGPVIESLALAGAAVGGATRDVVATLAEVEAGVSIRLSADLVTVGQSAPDVLSVPFTFPLAGSVVLRAIAIDRFGNEGPIAELPVTVAANTAPGVVLEQLVPASGPAPSGSTLSVRVRGTDDVGVAVLKAAAEGAGSAPLVQSAGAPILLAVPVSPDAGPGASVRVHAEAIDGNGQSSGEQVFAVAVSDGAPPAVAFTAPAEGTALVPGSRLEVVLQGSDGFGVTRFELVAEGAVSASQGQDAPGAPGGATAAFALDLPPELASGESVTLRARAFDAAGHSAEAVLVLAAPDTRAPRLVELVPAEDAAVGVAPRIAARFDEPIARASATAASIGLFDAADAPVPAAIGFEDGDRVVTLTPAAPLVAGQRYHVVLTDGLQDPAGNPAADADGNPIAGLLRAFTVGGAVLTAPAAGQRVIEGQRFEAALAAEPALGGQAARFYLNDVLAATAALDAAGVARATLSAPTLAVAGGPALRVAGRLVLPGGAELAAGEVVLELLAAAGDFDGDGIANGDEVGYGTDPFADDRTLDDDGDGLTNTEEFALGTRHDAADSDGDGLEDGAELAAGLDPLDADSDDDGLPDGEDVLGGPRIVTLEPAAGAVNVSVRPRIRVRFDEPVAPAAVTAASFLLLENAATPVPASLVFSEGDRVVDLVPSAPLAFSTPYTLRLTNAITGTDDEPIRNPDGSELTVPLERSFTTGAFGITEPAGGALVRELSTLALTASGDAALGVASVRFEVNGAVVSTDASAPFETSYAVPAANVAPVLSITAIAFDAGAVELARDTIEVTVTVGLEVASRLLGVPLAGTRELVLRLPVPRATPLEVAIASLDPAVASVAAAPFTIPAGATELRVPVTGVAEGSTTLVATTLEDEVAIAVSVSALTSGATLDALAAPVGMAARPFPSLGQVAVAPSATTTLVLRLLDAPAAATTPLSIRTSDAGVADVGTPVAVAAGSTDAVLPITAGPSGAAVLEITGGGTGRELRVVIGTPGAGSTPPVVAPPVGIAILPYPSAGDVILPESSTRALTLRVLGTPAAADTELVIASSDPAVASIAGPVVIPAGSTDATFTITTGAAGTAIVMLVAGDDGRELRVTSGAPSPASTPPVVAPPVGIAVLEAGTAGTLFIEPGDTRSFELTLLAYPSLGDLPVSATSLDPSVATVSPGAQVLPTGESAITLTVTATAAGNAETRIDLAFGVERRTLRVVVGVPAAASAPTTVAPPVGLGAFGLVTPRDGDLVAELTTLAIGAAGDASFGIASVRFEVNGAVVATDTSAPFRTDFAVAAASETPVLSITAIAFDAEGVEVGRETITVSVGAGVTLRAPRSPRGGLRGLARRPPELAARPLDPTRRCDEASAQQRASRVLAMKEIDHADRRTATRNG
ncbi:MAG: carboxypeptidase regulatory-like domain-containing protein [Deltaproteobacteria bacterium]|nr:carboxypeptidase regulatory-like domain-containing protein [Deltaproteobacteria bacterium]